jgi:hypothetical protein
VGVGEHLHLEVARALEVALDDDAVVAEGRLRLAAGGGGGLLELVRPSPPPPATALTITGKPPAPPAGTTGTPAAVAASLAAPLSPMSSIAAGGGPIHTRPAACTARANAAFSLRKP